MKDANLEDDKSVWSYKLVKTWCDFYSMENELVYGKKIYIYVHAKSTPIKIHTHR